MKPLNTKYQLTKTNRSKNDREKKKLKKTKKKKKKRKEKKNTSNYIACTNQQKKRTSGKHTHPQNDIHYLGDNVKSWLSRT